MMSENTNVLKETIRDAEVDPRWDLTISIVSYYNKKDIENFLDSFYVLVSPSLRKHVFIINNSTDAIQDLESKYQDLSVLQMSKNLGFGAGHNAVLNKIDSRYHAIVNPDIIYAKDAFSDLVQYMDESADVGMTAPLICGEDGHIQKVYRRQLTVFDLMVRYCFPKLLRKRLNYHTMQDVPLDKPFVCDFVQGSFLLIRSHLFQQLCGFDERYFMYAEDADLCRRVNAISKVTVYPQTHVVHKWKKESHCSWKLLKIHAKSLIAYFHKWGWKIV